MTTVGLADLQKNISILSNLTEAITIVDKRKKIDVAIIYPINNKKKIAGKMAGKYSKMIPEKLKEISLDKAVEIAMYKSLKEKYEELY